MKKFFILLNPSSAGGRALRNRERIEQQMRLHNLEYEICITQSEEHLRKLVVEIAPRAKGILAAGGDSTLTILAHEVIVRKIKLPIGVLPLGSSDDIALDWGVPRLEEAVEILLQEPLSTDAGVIYNRSQGKDSPKLVHHFLGQCNVGIGVEINRGVAETLHRSPRLRPFQTLVGLYWMRRAFRDKTLPIEISWAVDEKSEPSPCEVVSLLLGKIRYWAGGKLYLPGARPDDGNLQMVLVHRASFWRTLLLTLRSVDGSHLALPEVESAMGPRFFLSSSAPFQLQIDGDIFPESFHRVEIRTLPAALRVWRKAPNKPSL